MKLNLKYFTAGIEKTIITIPKNSTLNEFAKLLEEVFTLTDLEVNFFDLHQNHIDKENDLCNLPENNEFFVQVNGNLRQETGATGNVKQGSLIIANFSIIFILETNHAIRNLSVRSIDSELKKHKFTSLLDKDIFEELPFFYKKCVYSLFNNLDRNLEGKKINPDEINKAIFKVLMTLSPEVSLNESFHNTNSKFFSYFQHNQLIIVSYFLLND